MLPARHRPAVAAALLAFLLAACGGGGGGGGSSSPPPPPPPTTGTYTDPQVYSNVASASLANPNEITSVTKKQITLDGVAINYTATAGHLIALAPNTAARQASFFYVAYTRDGVDAATRPVTFFYNGGPGSATVWLHLGSYGPRRIATVTPATDGATPYPLVDNAESLLDVSDLVFVDAVGTGFSQAVAPNTNSTFWGVDADAAVFRDFIARWLAVNQRNASPKYLFGESYGGVRTGVLAHLLETAGIGLAGVVVLSPAMDYNTNCGITGAGLPCTGYVPSYGASGAFFNLTQPVVPPAQLPAFLDEVKAFANTTYDPAARALIANGAPPSTELTAQLQARTGMAAARWQVRLNMDPTFYRNNLVPNTLLGRYDSRVVGQVGSALASQGDPSSTYINSSFAQRVTSYLRDDLGYTTPSGYSMLSNAIASWNFSHDGRALPDAIPDLAAAIALNPRLKVFATGGYHDLATPYHVTERDIARLEPNPNVVQRYYPGGHMTYLDDASRRAQKADLAQFYRSAAQ